MTEETPTEWAHKEPAHSRQYCQYKSSIQYNAIGDTKFNPNCIVLHATQYQTFSCYHSFDRDDLSSSDPQQRSTLRNYYLSPFPSPIFFFPFTVSFKIYWFDEHLEIYIITPRHWIVKLHNPYLATANLQLPHKSNDSTLVIALIITNDVNRSLHQG